MPELSTINKCVNCSNISQDDIQTAKRIILIAGGIASSREILLNILASEYTLLEASNCQEALDILSSYGTAICAVILDLVMPVMDGYGFLDAVSKKDELKSIPVIVATGNSDDEAEREALKHGAWDFITKPYNGEIVKFRLRSAIEYSRLSAYNQLKYLAEYDTLTGIYNKNKFFSMTREMLNTHKDKKFAFIRMDIDRFQLINAFFGFDEGDRLLCYMANGIKKNSITELYTYGRIEADVFAICCECKSRKSIITNLEKSVEYIKAYNRSFNVVPAYGVYFLDNLNLPVSEMLDRTALAVKPCKGNYDNSIGIYDPEMSEKLAQEQKIINEMVSALENKQFVIYLQPKYDLKTNTSAGAEALVRWQHPEKGLILPNEFIPIFEKNGFIAKLDYFVWEQVCYLLQLWIANGLNPSPISVNVSRANLYNPNTVKMIDKLVHKYSVPLNLFQLELTESAYTDNPQMMEQFTDELHQKGYTILMDDFGSGYSSLSLLKNLPVDVLKIDTKFFEDTKISGRGENIIASVIRMAKWLRIPTVAEGVEKEDQVNFLRSVGCDYVQGFYFSPPMSIDSYEKLIAQNVPVANIQSTQVGAFDVDRLWSSDKEIDALFINTMQASCIYEFDGEHIEVLRVNKAYTELLGFRERVKSALSEEYALASDLSTVLNAFRKCSQDKENSVCVYRRKDSPEKVRWVKLGLQYICPIGNKHILMGNLIDITETKSMEFTIEKLRERKTGQVLFDAVDERIFEINQVYSYLNLRMLMGFLTPIFDVIRLVDPVCSTIVTVEDNGILKSEHYRCFHLWGKETRCENCTSIYGMRENCSMTKYEFFQNNVFYVVSNPIKVEDANGKQHSLVLEIVSRVSDHIMLGRSGEKTIGQLIEETQNKIYTDDLTGIYNRRYFREMMYAHHGQTGVVKELGLVMLDLYSFKTINDKHGHVIGDEVLVKTANVLLKSVTQTDSVIRYGGDEFIVILANRTEDEVKEAIKLMRSKVSKIRYGEGDAWKASADFGYAYTENFDFTKETATQMLLHADRAMYKDKQAHRTGELSIK